MIGLQYNSVAHQVSDWFATDYCLYLERFVIISPVEKGHSIG